MRPLTSKRAVEVAFQLMGIILLLGAPQILEASLQHHSSQNTIFCGPISSWFTGSLATPTVKDPLNGWTVMWKTCWLHDLVITIPQSGLLDCDLFSSRNRKKPCSYHSPYKALFGTDAHSGLCTFALRTDILEHTVFQGDLIAIYATKDLSRTQSTKPMMFRNPCHTVRHYMTHYVCYHRIVLLSNEPLYN